MSHFRKVSEGQAFRGFPKELYNQTIDALRWVEQQRNRTGAGKPPRPRSDFGLVKVLNTSSTDCDRFGVLGIGTPGILPSSDLDGFKNLLFFTGVSPTVAGKFVLCAEPIKQGDIGDAWICGVCPVQIKVNTVGDGFCDVLSGDLTQLNSATSGSAEILWVASGTGTQWGLVRFPRGGSGGGGQARWVRFQLAQALGFGTAGAEANVLEYWDGSNPIPSGLGNPNHVYVWNCALDGNSPPTRGYLFSGLINAVGVACCDPATGDYHIVNMECGT